MQMLKIIINIKSHYFFILSLGLLVLSSNEWIKVIQTEKINQKLVQNEIITEENYEALSLYSSAYQLGVRGEHVNAIEKYTKLVRMFPENSGFDIIYYNIGTLYLQDALTKPLSDDGKVTAENFQKLQSAIEALKKALAINPENTMAKFNLSLLLSSMPTEATKLVSEQSVQELSNIPIGLP